jgi:hypothetical protein
MNLLTMTLEQLHEKRSELLTFNIHNVAPAVKKVELQCIDRRIAQLIDKVKGEA